MRRRPSRFPWRYGVFSALLLLQLGWWHSMLAQRPAMTIVPPAPALTTVHAIALGDSEFYFRLLSFEMQNFGDTFGRFTPLKQYDYAVLAEWFHLLDTLNATSNFVPAIAGYYYSQTQNKPDVRYIVDYLTQHAGRNPAGKWWWLFQAAYLAEYKLSDRRLALEIAYQLAAVQGDLPLWARQMPAFILEKMGERQAALKAIEGVLAEKEKLSAGELNFMRYFIEERLKLPAPASLK